MGQQEDPILPVRGYKSQRVDVELAVAREGLGEGEEKSRRGERSGQWDRRKDELVEVRTMSAVLSDVEAGNDHCNNAYNTLCI